MYYRNKAYSNAIQKVRIEFGTLIGLDKDEDAFVVLKELPTMETLELKEAQEKGQLDLMKYFRNVLPQIVVEHNLWESEDKKMTNDAVVSFIFEKVDLTSKVITEYSNNLFSSRANKKEEK